MTPKNNPETEWDTLIRNTSINEAIHLNVTNKIARANGFVSGATFARANAQKIPEVALLIELIEKWFNPGLSSREYGHLENNIRQVLNKIKGETK